MTKTVYDQHQAAFSRVSAFIILNKKREVVGRVAFKYPQDGAGRLSVYFHVFGFEMVKGTSSGYGYDKDSAAVANAVGKCKDTETSGEHQYILDLLSDMYFGWGWSDSLEIDRRGKKEKKTGFKVVQAV